MEYISGAGRRWIRRHEIDLADLDTTTSRYGGTERQISRQRIDPHRFHTGVWSDRYDALERRGRYWVLHHRYLNYIYSEQGSGHAKLKIIGASLLDTVCSSLYQSTRPLADVAQVPRRSFVSAAHPLIISATNKIGCVEFLLRIDWHRFEPAWEPAKPRTHTSVLYPVPGTASFSLAPSGQHFPPGRSLYERMIRAAGDRDENL